MRFSIQQLLAGTGVVAVGCVALRNAGPWWVSSMLGLTVLVLTGAIVLAVHRTGPERAFWIGFSAFACAYLALLMHGWSHDLNTSYNNPLRDQELVTSRLSAAAYDKLCASSIAAAQQATYQRAMSGMMSCPGGGPGPMGSGMYGGPMSGGMPMDAAPVFNGPMQPDFVNVAHALWTLLLAACGGWFARWQYSGPSRRDPVQSKP